MTVTVRHGINIDGPNRNRFEFHDFPTKKSDSTVRYVKWPEGIYPIVIDRPKTDALVHLARMTLANNRLLNFTSNLPEKLQYGKTLKK